MVLTRRGFTFVELLIAATMLSVLFAAVGSHLRGGLTVWQRVQGTLEPLQHQRVAWEQLQRDLAAAVIYDPRANAYGSGDGELPGPQFASGGLAWFTVDRTVRPLGSVQFVEYRCEAREGRQALWRFSRSVEQARVRQEPRAKLLIDGCETLACRFAYLPSGRMGALQWEPQWQDAYKELPRLVEVTVTLAAAPGERGRELRRLLAVPVGALKELAPPAGPAP